MYVDKLYGITVLLYLTDWKIRINFNKMENQITKRFPCSRFKISISRWNYFKVIIQEENFEVVSIWCVLVESFACVEGDKDNFPPKKISVVIFFQLKCLICMIHTRYNTSEYAERKVNDRQIDRQTDQVHILSPSNLLMPVVDQDSPDRDANYNDGGANLIFWPIFLENCIQRKNTRRGRAFLAPPLDLHLDGRADQHVHSWLLCLLRHHVLFCNWTKRFQFRSSLHSRSQCPHVFRKVSATEISGPMLFLRVCK